MFYIISPLNLEQLKKYHIPRADIWGNPDLLNYEKTDEGKEFFNIAPMRIISANTKEQLIFRISTDISFFSMCYNCPLYIYVMNKKTYKKLLNFKIDSHINMGKVQELLKDLHIDNQDKKIDPKTTYYNSDEKVITEELEKLINSISSENYEIYLTKEKGFTIANQNI